MNRETSKRTLSLDEVHERVRAQAQGHWDISVPRHELLMQDGHLLLPHNGSNGHPDSLSPTTWATAQLCQRLNIPTSYFRRCPAELQDAQANHWLRRGRETNGNGANGDNASGETNDNSESHLSGSSNGHGKGHGSEKWLLRADHAMLRGVLSEHYSPLDNTQLMDSLRPLLNGHYRAEWFGLSDETLHLRVIDPSLTRDVLPDDALTAGFHLSNSEVGRRAVTVDACIYRLVCSNGLVAMVRGKSLLRQRHIHVSQPRFEVALEEAVGEAVRTASGFVEQMKRATQQPVRDVEKALERLGIRMGLSQSVLDEARRSMLSERPDQQSSLYGLINGLTRAAQTLPDENRYDLEVLAGRLAETGLRSLDGDGPRRRSRPRSRDGEPNAEETWSAVDAAEEMFEAEVASASTSAGREVER